MAHERSENEKSTEDIRKRLRKFFKSVVLKPWWGSKSPGNLVKIKDAQIPHQIN